MKLLVIAVLCVTASTAPLWAAPPKPAPTPVKPSSGAATVAYVRRIETISSDLRLQLADLWAALDKIETVRDAIDKPDKKHTDDEAKKQEWETRKAGLQTLSTAIRASTKRLRGVSPVPRSLKKADADFVDGSFEIEGGLESLQHWLNTPSPELDLQLKRQLRKGITSWTNALVAMNRLTDPAVKSKPLIDE